LWKTGSGSLHHGSLSADCFHQNNHQDLYRYWWQVQVLAAGVQLRELLLVVVVMAGCWEERRMVHLSLTERLALWREPWQPRKGLLKYIPMKLFNRKIMIYLNCLHI
jgi:hypothetical protein